MSWACDHCGNLNASDGAPCESCGRVREAPPAQQPAPPPEIAAEQRAYVAGQHPLAAMQQLPPDPYAGQHAYAPPQPPPPGDPARRRGMPESIISLVAVGAAYIAGFLGFFF